MRKLYPLILGCVFLNCTEDPLEEPQKKEEVASRDLLSLSAENFKIFEIPVEAEVFTTPNSKPFSFQGDVAQLDFVVNDDNTADIYWEEKIGERWTRFRRKASEGDKTGTKQAIVNRHITKVDLATGQKIRDINIPSGTGPVGTTDPKTGFKKGNKFLGFASLGNGDYVIGYSQDNKFSTDFQPDGQPNARATYSRFDGNTGTEKWTTDLWDEQNLNRNQSRGEAAKSGSALLRYHKEKNVIAVHLSYTRMTEGSVPEGEIGELFPPETGRHQGGYIGYLDPETGEILKRETTDKEGNTKENHIGGSWYLSHNLDQKGQFDKDGNFYTLNITDAGDGRGGNITKWNHESTGNTLLGRYHFYANPKTGESGTTGGLGLIMSFGDLTPLPDGNVAFVYSNPTGRTKRDLRLGVIGNFNGKNQQLDGANLVAHSWITELGGESSPDSGVGQGAKIQVIDNKYLLIGWNVWDEINPKVTVVGKAYFTLASLDGKQMSKETYAFPVTDRKILHINQSFQVSPDGKTVYFVSANGSNLELHSVSLEQ